MLLGPLAGAVADRVDQRRLLAAAEAGQGVIYAALAITRPPLPVLLPLVILAALLQTFGTPAGKGAVRRLVPEQSRPQANALLSLGLNLQIILGPALGGVLAGLSGVSLRVRRERGLVRDLGAAPHPDRPAATGRRPARRDARWATRWRACATRAATPRCAGWPSGRSSS